ncbi:NUDIX domain-containing protein [Staphylococcus sp. GDY8P85P]|uniref:NUDIX hydrolase n=1 Tax=Staphylococcus sp. GDY8P85P TaxID=2804138 RepID=UPI001AEC276B|nr:NUDIX domain-containing protein [Staphylococcus sp. GDY8P85P]
MEIKKHIGIYGVCFEQNKLLCIKKNSGPYRGRFDLPGGSPKKDEGLTETLKREILEETGYYLSAYRNSRVYDAFVKERESNYIVHHIMIIYDIDRNITIQQRELSKFVDNELNDSEAEVWVDLEEINLENSSPLILKIKKELLGEISLDTDVYNDWITK